MAHPKLVAAGLLQNVEWHALPDALVILNPGMDSDRVQRVRYAEIASVVAGTRFPTFLSLILLGIALFFGLIASVTGFHWLAVLLTLLPLVPLPTLLVRRQSILVVTSVGGVFRMTKNSLSARKRKAFVDAVLGYAAAEQGAEPIQRQP